MDQQELWAAPNEPKALRVSLERDWLSGSDHWDLSMSVQGTKTAGSLWIVTQHFSGRHSAVVATKVIEAAVLRFDSAGWATEPQVQAQDRWERHLHTY